MELQISYNFANAKRLTNLISKTVQKLRNMNLFISHAFFSLLFFQPNNTIAEEQYRRKVMDKIKFIDQNPSASNYVKFGLLVYGTQGRPGNSEDRADTAKLQA